MTVDEAIEIVETVLDYQHLNKVQELVFRQSWEGRSYIEIAKSSGYEADYIKDAGAKLWKLLSEAFGEKVKKDNLESVIKRYLRRNQVNVQRNLTIEVNLTGANLSGANLNGARVVANFIETDSSQAVSPKAIMPDDNSESVEEGNDREIESDSEDEVYYWNDLPLRSPEQVKMAEALDRTNVLFFPNSKARLTTTEGKQNQEPDFLVFHEGKWGIIEIDSEVSDRDAVKSEKCDRTFQTYGIAIVQHYEAIRCAEQPDAVIQEFLDILSQS